MQVTDKQVLRLVARNLRKLRQERALSLNRLSKLSDTYPSNIKRIEDEDHQPSIGLLARIAAALDVPITALFSGENNFQKAS